MNMKKQYIVPTTEVVDVEIHLLTGVSMRGDSNTPEGPQWNDSDSESADYGW